MCVKGLERVGKMIVEKWFEEELLPDLTVFSSCGLKYCLCLFVHFNSRLGYEHHLI